MIGSPGYTKGLDQQFYLEWWSEHGWTVSWRQCTTAAQLRQPLRVWSVGEIPGRRCWPKPAHLPINKGDMESRVLLWLNVIIFCAFCLLSNFGDLIQIQSNQVQWSSKFTHISHSLSLLLRCYISSQVFDQITQSAPSWKTCDVTWVTVSNVKNVFSIKLKPTWMRNPSKMLWNVEI